MWSWSSRTSGICVRDESNACAHQIVNHANAPNVCPGGSHGSRYRQQWCMDRAPYPSGDPRLPCSKVLAPLLFRQGWVVSLIVNCAPSPVRTCRRNDPWTTTLGQVPIYRTVRKALQPVRGQVA